MIANRNTKTGLGQQMYNEEMFIDIFTDEPLSSREIEFKIRCSRDTVKTYMNKLVDKGLIKKKRLDIGWIYWKP